MLDRRRVNELRKEFPILTNPNTKTPLVYFDNGATTQKPIQVIESLKTYYEENNGNPHRGAHRLATKATEEYEDARKVVGTFIGAKTNEIVFVRNATEGINLVAYSYGLHVLKEGDEILISILEHHANLVPWQKVAKETGAKLIYLYGDDDRQITLEEVKEKVSEKTKILALTMSSNVTGTQPDLVPIISYFRQKSTGKIILDGAQFVPHHHINISSLDCDFMVFSGHKMYSPMGIGVLWGKEDILNQMEPFNFGGDMIEYVYEDHATFLPSPQRFEAGTPNVGGAVALAEAIRFIESIGIDDIAEYEKKLTDFCYDELSQMKDIEVYTTSNSNRGPLVAFNFKEIHPHDVASILDQYGIAIRSGHHCAQPLHRYLGCNFSCRASFAFYNTSEEVEFFVEHLDKVRRLMGFGS